MKLSDLRPRLAALLTAIVVSVGLLGLSTAPAWAAFGTVTEFPVSSSPSVITAGPDGNLWFTEEGSHQIGRITPSGAITEFHIKTKNSDPRFITAGPDGNLWFTLFLGGFIERISPAGSFSCCIAIPTKGSRPEGITTGPDRNVWFAEELASKIGRISTS